MEAHLLKSHADKMMEVKVFEAGKIVISDTQLETRMSFLYCSL